MDRDLNSFSIRQKNMLSIASSEECQSIIKRMREIEWFIIDFGYLTICRNFVSSGNRAFSLQMISNSFELTLGSVISCCEAACLADAYTLLRKYKDDMLFYLYIVVNDSIRKYECNSQVKKTMDDNIEKWMNNDLRDLQIGKVMKSIAQSPSISNAVKKYKLQSFFTTIGIRLNNYVHSNGVSYYNQINIINDKKLNNQLRELLSDMRFITISFLFLLTLCSPLLIMSEDYFDYLDINATPPDGSQYRVAPFVNEFFKNNLDLIDKSSLEYLRKNTSMVFD